MKRILMLGDSLVERGDWAALLPDLLVRNRGISGETLSGLSCRLDSELEASPGFDAVVLQSGTNDVWNGDPVFPAIYSTLLPRLRLLTAAPLVLCSLSPIGLVPRERIGQLNAELRQMAGQVADCAFLDLERPLAAALARKERIFLADGVHFSDRGYAIWAAELCGCLRRILDGSMQQHEKQEQRKRS